MKIAIRALGAACVVASLQANVHAAVIYDVTSDFSISNGNPNGVWTYGYSASGGATYSLINSDRIYNTAVAIGWGSNAVNNQNAPMDWKNISSSTINGVAPGQFTIHPGPAANGDYGVLRFVTPIAGIYSIASTFFTGDVGDTDARVLKNADFLNPLAFASSTTGNFAFNTTLSLATGDTLDFVVGNKGSFFSDNTPLSVVITPSAQVPEPGTLLVLTLGLGILGVVRCAQGYHASI